MQKFSGQVSQASDDQPDQSRGGTTRRRLMKGAAWTAPAIAFAQAAPAYASSPTGWSAKTNNSALGLTSGIVGLSLAGLLIASDQTLFGPSQSPHSYAEATYGSLQLLQLLGITVNSATSSAPGTGSGLVTQSLVAASIPGLLSVGVVTANADAEWVSATDNGNSAMSSSETTGVEVAGIASTGDIKTKGATSMISAGGVQTTKATSTGTIASLSILNGTAAVAIVGDAILTATASGASGAQVGYTLPTSISVTATGFISPSQGKLVVNGSINNASVTIDTRLLGIGAVIKVSVGDVSKTKVGAADAVGSVTVLTIAVDVYVTALVKTTTTLSVMPLTAEAHSGL